MTLPLLRSAIEQVKWPEIDLSHLYVREQGDERWPVSITASAA